MGQALRENEGFAAPGILSHWDVSDIWAIGQEASFVFAGPKIEYMDEESKESFLNWVDDTAISGID